MSYLPKTSPARGTRRRRTTGSGLTWTLSSSIHWQTVQQLVEKVLLRQVGNLRSNAEIYPKQELCIPRHCSRLVLVRRLGHNQLRLDAVQPPRIAAEHFFLNLLRHLPLIYVI